MAIRWSFILPLITVVASSQCRTGAKGPQVDADLSRESSIAITLPSKDQIRADLRDKLSGYRLVVEKTGGNCKAQDVLSKVGTYAQTSLTESLLQDCDYSIGLEIGAIAANGTALDKVYFSNYPAARQGKAVTKGEIQGKTDFAVALVLKVTQDGIAAGFAKPADVQITPPGNGGANANISIVIPSPTGPAPAPVNPPPPTWQQIAPDAGTYCGGCHADAKGESWWNNVNSARRIIERLSTSDQALRMPKETGPTVGPQMSAETRQRMLEYERSIH